VSARLTMTRAQLRNVLLFALSVSTLTAVLPRAAWSLWWLRYATYFTVYGLVAFWLLRLIALLRTRWSSPVQALRENWAEALLAVAAMAVLFMTHDWQFKVLSDETNLVGVGRSFASEWRFDFPGESKFYFGAHHYFRYVFDKRPPLFAFTLGLVDSAFGYRVKNVWYLNGAYLGLTVLVTASFLRERIGRPWNLLAVGWAIANPIVMLTGSAAGVEPLLGLLWAIVGIAMLLVLEDPTRERFGFLVATVMMIAHTRLEAGPMAALMFAGMFVASKERRQLIDLLRDDALVWLAPIVAMPIISQKALKGDYFQGLTKHPFGMEHVLGNVGHWKVIFADGGKFFPYSAMVTAAEVLAFFVLLALLLRGRTEMTRAEKAAFLIFSAITCLMVAMYTSYFWGQPSTATSTRFYALPLFFAGLLVPILLRRITALRERADVLAVVSALVFVHAFAAVQNRAFMNTISQRKEHKIVTDFVFPMAKDKSILFVTGFPGQFHLYDVASIGFGMFKRTRGTIYKELEHKLWDDVIFAQEINFTTGKASDTTTLPDDVHVEVIEERHYGNGSFIRISRLKHDPGAAPPADAPPPKDPENGYQEDEHLEGPEHAKGHETAAVTP
jgi:hypothetical protein